MRFGGDSSHSSPRGLLKLQKEWLFKEKRGFSLKKKKKKKTKKGEMEGKRLTQRNTISREKNGELFLHLDHQLLINHSGEDPVSYVGAGGGLARVGDLFRE